MNEQTPNATFFKNKDFYALFNGYPLYSQDTPNPLVVAKLFDIAGGATWFLTELDQKNHVAFGFTAGLHEDELGYVSLEELASLKHLVFKALPRIERDLHFEQKGLDEVKAQLNHQAY